MNAKPSIAQLLDEDGYTIVEQECDTKKEAIDRAEDYSWYKLTDTERKL